MKLLLLTTLLCSLAVPVVACESYEDCMQTKGYKSPGLSTYHKTCLEQVGTECGRRGRDCGYIEVPCPDNVQMAIAFKLDEINRQISLQNQSDCMMVLARHGSDFKEAKQICSER